MRSVLVGVILLGLAYLLLSRNPGNGEPPAPPKVTLRDYGVVADGLSDDSAAIQKAIDAGRGGIHFPAGTYKLTKTITIDLDKTGYAALSSDGTAKVVMMGAGPAFRFIGTHEGTAEPTTFKSPVWDRQRTPTIEGLEIVGMNPEADGIEAIGTMQLTLNRVTIRECRHGVHLVKRNRNVLLSACHIYSNRGIGVFYDQVNLHQSNIVGCHISYCDQGGVVSRGGDVRNIQISGCDIEGNMGKDQPPTANILLDSTGGSVAEVAITGCSIQHNKTGNDSANIRIIGGGEGGHRLGKTQEGHVTIGDNVLSDVRVNIDIQNARGVTITNNTFWMGWDWNLRVEKSQQILVGPNLFERNPRYDYGSSNDTKNGLIFRDCQDCTLTGLHIHRTWKTPAALTLENCSRFNVNNCTILDCDGIGLLLKKPLRSRFSGLLIRNDLETKEKKISVRLEEGTENSFGENTFANGVEGIR